MHSAHQCPPHRGLVPYFASIVEHSTRSVLVKHENSVTTFPQIQSGEIPHRGKDMSDCFSAKLADLIGTTYELVFLYSTINESYRRYLPNYAHFAVFECVAAIDAETGTLVQPARSEYRWVSIDYPGDGFTGTMDGLNYYAWQRADMSFTWVISERDNRPWETPGWLSETMTEVAKVLKNMQYTVTGSCEQHQISSTAAVLRIPTNRGRLYLKASHRREGLTMKCVSEFAPFLVPSPLYVNPDMELMLMNDYGPTLADRFTRKDYEKVLVRYGELQLASLEHIDELMKIGVARTDFKSFKAKAKELLEDEGVNKSLRVLSGVSDMGPYHDALYTLLQKLYVDLDLPISIVHRDIYDDNMIKTEEEGMEHVIYDWGSARIDIPFTDVMDFRFEISDVSQEEREKIGIESYLAVWERYGSIDYLKKVCSALYAKELLLRLVELHELAKEKFVEPILLDKDIKRLWDTLLRIKETPPI